MIIISSLSLYHLMIKNFDRDGKIIANLRQKMIHEVEEGKEYALLMSTQFRRMAVLDRRYNQIC